jgi:signal transduction histidine kinase
MKPLLSEERNNETLQNLGRASLQIIHDIKNQLNGLKLYATYLRKRMEKIEQANELQETLGKLIGGIDRAANDLNVLVQYGRPIAITKHQGIDVQRLVRSISETWTNGEPACELVTNDENEKFTGEFDPTALTEAFKSISAAAAKAVNRDNPEPVQVRLSRVDIESVPSVLVEWKPVYFETEEPFRSFGGSDAIRMALAAKIVEAHGGSAIHEDHALVASLPLSAE